MAPTLTTTARVRLRRRRDHRSENAVHLRHVLDAEHVERARERKLDLVVR